MKGDDLVIERLNDALTAELTAINQYVIHGRMRLNWGYKKLAKESYDESIDEMKHAQALIDRILFLDGAPNMQRYKIVRVGNNVREQIEFELVEELDAVRMYNESARICREKLDNGSADLFETLLKDEEGHVDHLEAELNLISQIGLERFLAQHLE